MKIFCKHDWKVLLETTTKSKFEASMEVLGKTNIEKKISLPHQLCCAKRMHIQIIVCPKCGKLKRFTSIL
jgi:hypothetical protein